MIVAWTNERTDEEVELAHGGYRRRQHRSRADDRPSRRCWSTYLPGWTSSCSCSAGDETDVPSTSALFFGCCTS